MLTRQAKPHGNNNTAHMRFANYIAGQSRLVVIAILAGMLAMGAIAWIAMLDLADLKKEKSLEQELDRLMPSLSGADAILRERDAVQRAESEVRGWADSRIDVAAAVQKAAGARPTSMKWSKVVAQSELLPGSPDPDLAYPPRLRKCRLVISGKIEGRLADLVIRSYVETLSASNMLGADFMHIRCPGLRRPIASDTQTTCYDFNIEAQAIERRIDKVPAL
jgi:hypothetical protein